MTSPLPGPPSPGATRSPLRLLGLAALGVAIGAIMAMAMPSASSTAMPSQAVPGVVQPSPQAVGTAQPTEMGIARRALTVHANGSVTVHDWSALASLVAEKSDLADAIRAGLPVVDRLKTLPGYQRLVQ